MRSLLIVSMIGVAIGVGLTVSVSAQQSGDPGPSPWSRWHSVMPWRMGSGMMGGGMMGASPRHPYVMMNDVPEAYRSLANTLPKTQASVERGAKVYAQNCTSCHGATGLGDGPASKDVNPRPANLAWLARMPMVDWDPFMFWSVAEGGAAFGTAMPAFKTVLSKDDTWAVIAYIQAQLRQQPVQQ